MFPEATVVYRSGMRKIGTDRKLDRTMRVFSVDIMETKLHRHTSNYVTDLSAFRLS